MINWNKYYWNILIALDQLANAILFGDPDETLSSRAGKGVDRYIVWYLLCVILDYFDPDHCEKYIEEDEGKDSAIM